MEIYNIIIIVIVIVVIISQKFVSFGIINTNSLRCVSDKELQSKMGVPQQPSCIVVSLQLAVYR